MATLLMTGITCVPEVACYRGFLPAAAFLEAVAFTGADVFLGVTFGAGDAFLGPAGLNLCFFCTVCWEGVFFLG
jgi:hypothetical protein